MGECAPRPGRPIRLGAERLHSGEQQCSAMTPRTRAPWRITVGVRTSPCCRQDAHSDSWFWEAEALTATEPDQLARVGEGQCLERSSRMQVPTVGRVRHLSHHAAPTGRWVPRSKSLRITCGAFLAPYGIVCTEEAPGSGLQGLFYII